MNNSTSGNAISFDPSIALTEFLYSGEQFDSKIGQQYLRQRYYDPVTGRFNRLDPFFGNLNDPQSLHKYLYTHADPINGIDPSGEFFWSIISKVLSLTSGIGLGTIGIASIASLTFTVTSYIEYNDISSLGGRFLTDKEKKFFDFFFRAAIIDPMLNETDRVSAESAIGATMSKSRLWNIDSMPNLLYNMTSGSYFLALMAYKMNGKNIGAITIGRDIYFGSSVPLENSPDIHDIALIGHELMHSWQVEYAEMGTPAWLISYLSESTEQWFWGANFYRGNMMELMGFAIESTIKEILKNKYPNLVEAVNNGSVYTDPQYNDIHNEIRWTFKRKYANEITMYGPGSHLWNMPTFLWFLD
ncbi:MAG: hypothetical protein LBP87_01795 [Planctomycetaceae bacterium]|nr:hypothetical protein [Planctomycetaceae bacterium]